MLERYVLSIIGFSLAFAQHRTVLIANYPHPRFKLGPFIFDTSTWIGGFATLCMRIGGFFFSVWWWALLAMAIAIGTNDVGRKVMHMYYRWLSSLSGALIGLLATLNLLR
ncbi:MAG: hypothetical protein VB856_09360 [Rhodospirillales bacterium]